MITKEDCFNQLRDVIDAVLSTVDENGNPQSRIIDIMHIEDEKIYFLTGRGKDVYREIINHPKVSYLSLKDNKSIRISGEAYKLDDQKYWIDLNTLFVTLGQNVCKPTKPMCMFCPISVFCVHHKNNKEK